MIPLKDIGRSSGMLALIAGVVAAALAGTNALTKDTIAQRSEQAANEARLQVIDADAFTAATLATEDGEVAYYVAVQNDQTVGYVFTATVSGKSSGLVVMTGIDTAGAITGVAVTENNETAGYVDKVTDGGLLDAFAGKAADGALTLGLDVDSVSQATKTSKGVLDGVNAAIAYYTQIKEGT